VTNPSTTAPAPRVPAIRGGIELAPHKQGLGEPIVKLGIPPLLRFTVSKPLVKVGDTVLAGQPIANGILASTSGSISQVTANEKTSQQATIELVPDGKHALSPTITQAESALAAIEAAGITGLGGAGFSTLTKLQALPQSPLHTLVINAAECEPLICCDEALMLEHAPEIILGVGLLMEITQCQQCMIAIEDTKPKAIKSIQSALAKQPNSKRQLVVVPTRYPGGAETVLLRQLTGKPLTKDQRPTDHGLLCFNIATAYSVQLAAAHQPDFGRVVSIGGSAATHPCNVQAMFGTPINDVLEQTGNANAGNTAIKLGGPVSGLDVNPNELDNFSVTAKSNAIIINKKTSASQELACIRCGDCADACPEQLLPQQLFRYQHDNDKLSEYKLAQCIECRCCDLVCPSDIPLTDYFRQGKHNVRLQQQMQQEALLAEARYEAREARLARKAIEREQQIEETKRKVATAVPAAHDIKAALARAKGANKPRTSNDKPNATPGNTPGDAT